MSPRHPCRPGQHRDVVALPDGTRACEACRLRWSPVPEFTDPALVVLAVGRPMGATETGLAAMQAAVGGYVDRIVLPDGLVMLVNEDGRMHGLPHNPTASAMAAQPVVGTCVVLSPTAKGW